MFMRIFIAAVFFAVTAGAQTTATPTTASTNNAVAAASAGSGSNVGTEIAGGIIAALGVAAVISCVTPCYAASAGACIFGKVPKGAPACLGVAAGVAGIVAGVMMVSAASKSQSTGVDPLITDTTTTLPTGAINPITTTTSPITTASSSGTGALAAAIKSAKAAGIGINPTTGAVTLPNGQTISGQQAASGNVGGGSSASPSDVKSAFADMMKTAKDQAAAQGIEADGTAGDSLLAGAGSSRPAGSGISDSGPSAAGKAAAMKNANRGVASVAGSVKVLNNGETIGVAADSLFGMMNRRYSSEIVQGKVLLPAGQAPPATGN